MQIFFSDENVDVNVILKFVTHFVTFQEIALAVPTTVAVNIFVCPTQEEDGFAYVQKIC